VVGRFASDGNSQESELLADAETVLSAYRHNTYQDVRVLLVSPQAFETFKSSLTTNPTLSVEVQRESDYYAQQSKDLGTALFIVGYIVGGTMAIGALFGALNTMYSAVSARSVEIATLRAIGFGPGPVVISVLVESLMLSLLGAAVGASLAWLFFHGNTLSTLAAGGTSTQLVFTLAVSPGLVVLGVVWACVIGIMGGLLPSIHAARLPVATALRAVA
jgi:putative ABC transport system permease protein